LTKSDGKRRDGFISILWREGRSNTWDVTVTNTVAASYVAITSARAAAAAEAAAQWKDVKYAEIAQTHLFYPSAFETMSPINVVGLEFISDICHGISRVTDDSQETSFIFQRISVAIQRFNAVIFSNSFCHTDDNTASLLEHTYRVYFFYNILLNLFALGNWVPRAIQIILIIGLISSPLSILITEWRLVVLLKKKLRNSINCHRSLSQNGRALHRFVQAIDSIMNWGKSWLVFSSA